jgi:hypothetical protein
MSIPSISGLVGSIMSHVNHAVSVVQGLTIAEAGNFIHIKPDTIVVHLSPEVGETLGPNFS